MKHRYLMARLHRLVAQHCSNSTRDVTWVERSSPYIEFDIPRTFSRLRSMTKCMQKCAHKCNVIIACNQIGLLFFCGWINTLCLKKVSPTFSTVTWKPILIIFSKIIFDTTCHQMTVQFLTSPKVCFCTTWEEHNQRNITFLSNAMWLLS